jgi:hypothetical protein
VASRVGINAPDRAFCARTIVGLCSTNWCVVGGPVADYSSDDCGARRYGQWWISGEPKTLLERGVSCLDFVFEF